MTSSNDSLSTEVTDQQLIEEVPLSELGKIFLKLGIIGFGGPAAHVALMEEEIVTKRKWLSREYFLDLLGATNLIPGPNSTEMSIHLGYILRGTLGMIVAGGSFILPAVFITLILAVLYINFGSLPAVEPLLYGIKPIVIVIIFAALYKLWTKAAKNLVLLIMGIVTFLMSILNLNPLIALFVGGLGGMILLNLIPGQKDNITTLSSSKGAKDLDEEGLVTLQNQVKTFDSRYLIQSLGVTLGIWISFGLLLFVLTNLLPSQRAFNLGLFFYIVGSFLYGSGYVLIAFIEDGLVNNYQWLTQDQLLEAVAIGQMKPGPIFATSTFIGFIIEGLPGAVLATIGIFTPSFLMVVALNPVLPQIRKSEWSAAFLDAINIAAIALMLAVTVELAYSTLLVNVNPIVLDIPAIFIALLGLVLVLRYKINTLWLVLIGSGLGYLFQLLL